MKIYTICEDCPCLTVDYEEGSSSSCNLGYDMSQEQLITVGSFGSEEWMQVSENCGIIVYSVGDSE